MEERRREEQAGCCKHGLDSPYNTKQLGGQALEEADTGGGLFFGGQKLALTPQSG